MSIPVALQLYTVREEMRRDFVGTLEKVAEIGYAGVEFAGFGGLPASKIKNLLDRLNLKAVGSHTDVCMLKDKLNEVIEYNLEIGSSYIICPWAEYFTKQDYIDAARFYNRIGEKCREKGLNFAYHNHDLELDFFDGERGLDIIYRETEPELVKAEIDTYWVKYAGVDPVGYVRKYTGRCPLVHLKDMEDEKSKNTTEVGEGILDIGALIKASEEAGTLWLVVEQDTFKRPALESAWISFTNLKQLNI